MSAAHTKSGSNTASKVTGAIEGMDPDLKGQLLTALIAAGGGGILGGLLSGSHQGESSSERRKRLIMNAMLGALLGGGAGFALTAGSKYLGDALKKTPEEITEDYEGGEEASWWSGLGGGLAGAGLTGALPAGAMKYFGLNAPSYMGRNPTLTGGDRLQQYVDQVHGTMIDPKDPAGVKQISKVEPGKMSRAQALDVLSYMTEKGVGGPEYSRANARQLMYEATGKLKVPALGRNPNKFFSMANLKSGLNIPAWIGDVGRGGGLSSMGGLHRQFGRLKWPGLIAAALYGANRGWNMTSGITEDILEHDDTTDAYEDLQEEDKS